MTHRIVDALKIVKIDGYQGELLVVLYEVFHVLGAGKSVGESREPVLDGLIADALLILQNLSVRQIDDDDRNDREEVREHTRKVTGDMSYEDIYNQHGELH